ncbi:hypothetical protein DRE_00980 [Drechslerella stenobrocha 248]|uniref:Uncharacterized protein n=1 Tax=Drechslerella stenobrocha 248 TaxID=1043628 RepID=W7HLP0_9PEZI|nr:hypothetical protein DRE_00980 [Drechslerella stenobrocha 248]
MRRVDRFPRKHPINPARADIPVPPFLDTIPIDIISHLVERVIDDERSLIAVSQTCRTLRQFALPRLRSHTVVLDISECLDGRWAQDPAYLTILDFINNRNFHRASSIRRLEIRDHLPVREGHREQSADSVQEFLGVFYDFLEKCTGLRKVLRDGHEHYNLKTTDLVRHLLRLPKLRILCVRIQHDVGWLYYQTPIFEDYERTMAVSSSASSTGQQSKGLVCLSLALEINLDRSWWADTWKFFSELLRSNVSTLQHFHCNGPDMQILTAGMGPGCLSNMQLRSLRFRMLFDTTKFREALGLTDPKPQGERLPEHFDLSKDPDAATKLLSLELFDPQDTKYGAAVPDETDICNYLRTPHLKRLQVCETFVVDPSPVDSPSALHLKSFRGLEVLEFQRGIQTENLYSALETAAEYHANTIRTIVVREAKTRKHLQDFSPGLQGLRALRRIEIHYNWWFNGTNELLVDVGGFWTGLNHYLTVRELHFTVKTLSLGQSGSTTAPFYRPLHRKSITPVYSTLFYLLNSRAGSTPNPSTATHSTSELAVSTQVITPFRARLQDSKGNDDLEGDIARYLSSMYPEPVAAPLEITMQTVATKLDWDVYAFNDMLTQMPLQIELFQLSVVQSDRVGDYEPIVKRLDTWRKVNWVWVYEPESKPLPL